MNLRMSIYGQVWELVWYKIWDQFEGLAAEQVWERVGLHPRGAVKEQVEAEIEEQVCQPPRVH